jgi:hypothetical protein
MTDNPPPSIDATHEFEAFFEQHLASIDATLVVALREESERLSGFERLLSRFSEAISQVRERGVEALPHFDTVHNELCVAYLLVCDEEAACEAVGYEPPMPSCSKRFDFHARCPAGVDRWIEVKTIQPQSRDGWERYQQAISDHRFPESARLVLEEEWLGGELYHMAFAARSKILEYTLETEEKIAECLDGVKGVQTHLVLCSDGFRWHREDLEDFLHFYRRGVHFEGDHFGLMERYFLDSREPELRRNIGHFGFLKRSRTSPGPGSGTWSVGPVTFDPHTGFHRTT